MRTNWQHLRNGAIHVTQQKTGWSVGDIPVQPELVRVLAAVPSSNLTFLVTEAGVPFTAAGSGNKFRDWCNETKLPKECSSHGLRKAACRRLAEAGCTVHEIAAISGHVSLAEIQQYTKAVNQVRLARAARAKTGTEIGEPETRFAEIAP